MDLETVVVTIREKLEKSYNLLLKHAGFLENQDIGYAAPGGEEIRKKIQPTIKVDTEQFEGDYTKAREKFIEEASFTTLNRLVGIKVMECRGFINRTVITKKSSTADKSEEHFLYLNAHPEKIKEPGQGINTVVEKSQQQLASEIPQLYRENRYGIFPRDSDTMAVIDLINSVPDEEWEKDDVIGWTYQYYHIPERQKLKQTKQKIDHESVKYQSQQYTPRWVVKYLVDNTLGRLYLEMYPNSILYEELDIPIPQSDLKQTREPKKLEEIKILDPACGSGNFIIYSFELLSKMYLEQGYERDQIPENILKYNLHGIDIDDRAAQLAILGLYFKAKNFSSVKKSYIFNIVSTDFYLFDGKRLANIKAQFKSSQGILNLLDLIWNRFNEARILGSLLDINQDLEQIRKMEEKNQPLLFHYSNWDQKIQLILQKIQSSLQHEPLYGEYIQRGLNFAELLLQSYDVVLSNPPYLDSANMDDSFKKSLKNIFGPFSGNLYASFIKRCGSFAKNEGYIGMITPQTFMFISSYEEVRKWLIKSFSIEQFIHFGLGGVFSETLVDTAAFVLFKGKSKKMGYYLKLDTFKRNANDKMKMLKEITLHAKNKNLSRWAFLFDQSRFHLIPGSPFVYWISDDIRNLFTKFKPLQKFAVVAQGLATADNDRFLRFWWEVNNEDISQDYKTDHKKWVMYAKGGPFNKWYGNLWWVVNWENEGREIKECFDDSGKLRSRPQNESYYLKEGITYSFVSSFGFSVRHLPFNCIFDVGGSSLFIKNYDIKLFLSLLTSILIKNIMKILNPTVNYQVGDLKNIPIPDSIEKSTKLAPLAQANIDIKKSLYSFHLIERDFKNDPLSWGLVQVRNLANTKKIIPEALKAFLVHKANLESQLLLNEAKVDEEVFRLYELLPNEVSLWDVVKLISCSKRDEKYISFSGDEENFIPLPRGEGFGEGDFDSGNLEFHPQLKAEEKIQGHPHLTSPLKGEEMKNIDPLKGEELKYLNPFKGEEMKNINEEIGRFKAVIEVLESEGVPVGIYPKRELNDQELNELKTLYLTHRHDRGSGKSEAIGGMEFGIVAEVAGKLRVSPQTVVEEIEEIDELPVEAVKDIMTEHIQALVLKIMREDSDGIVPVNAPTREKTLFHHLLEKWNELGIGNDYDWIERYLGTDIQHYLESKFFKDHCQRFMNRPIIYHLVSERRTIGFFVLHHAWNRDRVMLLSSKYCSEAKNTLNNLLASETNPKKRVEIENQLRELTGFTQALIELLQSGYSPTVDLGAARNCAPLQKKKLLASDVLSSKLMDKMLNAKWE
jgi:hypothetical protein